jgi:hypothetical protein
MIGIYLCAKLWVEMVSLEISAWAGFEPLLSISQPSKQLVLQG